MKKDFSKKKNLIFGGAGLIILGILVFATSIINTNRMVYEGEAFGFEIGMKKKEVFKVIEKKYKESFIIEEQSFGKPEMKFSELDLGSEHKELLLAADLWHLLFKEGKRGFYLNFKNEELFLINYYHQRIELP